MKWEQLLVFLPLVWVFYIMACCSIEKATTFHSCAVCNWSPLVFPSIEIFSAIRIKYAWWEKSSTLFFRPNMANVKPAPYNRCVSHIMLFVTIAALSICFFHSHKQWWKKLSFFCCFILIWLSILVDVWFVLLVSSTL